MNIAWQQLAAPQVPSATAGGRAAAHHAAAGARGGASDCGLLAPGDAIAAQRGAQRHDAGAVAHSKAHDAAGLLAPRGGLMAVAGPWSSHVADSQAALQRAAWLSRRNSTASVVAVTGSVGKTTARRMIEQVLRTQGSVTGTAGDGHDHTRLPLSMLALESEHDFAVYELWASSPGEIACQARICQPKAAVITNLGEAHLHAFGSLSGVAAALGELLEALPSDGCAVLCGDDPLLRRMAPPARCPVVWFGTRRGCDVQAADVQWAAGTLTFRVAGQPFRLSVWGRHHLYAALAALAVGRWSGASDRSVAEALRHYRGAPMRCEVRTHSGITWINDACHACPASMRAALELLRDAAAAGRRIAVLGDMRSLGTQSLRRHYELGRLVHTLAGAEYLVACGQFAAQIAAGARDAGMRPVHVHACDDALAAAAYLDTRLSAGDVVLLKGCRALQLERVLACWEHKMAAAAPTPPGSRIRDETRRA
jgi:UDP-N-acetylmuramoyl-tripeptide--D-alanyl-D-alanine ligase